MKCKLLYVALLLTIGLGCNDDSETLIATVEPEFTYVLPQGNHDYDVKIVDWYNRCGFYILYKFEPKDVYFDVNKEWKGLHRDTVTVWTSGLVGREYMLGEGCVYRYDGFGGIRDTIPMGVSTGGNGLPVIVEVQEDFVRLGRTQIEFSTGFEVEGAKEDYAGKQLEWIEWMFLNFYPDSILKLGMPMKIILGRNLNSPKGPLADQFYKISFNNLIFNYGDESLFQLDNEVKLLVKEGVHNYFLLDQILEKVESVADVEGFFQFTDYLKCLDSDFPNEEHYSNGILSRPLSLSSLSDLKKHDLRVYIQMIIGNSKVTLETEPQNGNFDTRNYLGILHSKKDINGLIRKKYNTLTQAMKKIGIDLQAIGDLYH